MGHQLAMSNLYGFGRLAWNPELSSDRIAEEWTRLTFGDDPRVVKITMGILRESWSAYENYSGSLGIGTLTDIIGVHFGPGVESSERNGWGQWHRADDKGVGMDRTTATGTGFIAQYPPEVARVYESLATCPEDLLLFMHHVPYTHRLKSGKTVIQHIYDQHYLGAEQAAGFVTLWRSIEGLVDRERYAEVLDRLEFQAGHAIVWRDAVNGWFQRTSGIADERGRVGRQPGRVEAESTTLTGFVVADVTPWETASNGKAVTCSVAAGCAATFEYRDSSGTRDIVVQYYDHSDGAARYRLLVAGREVDRWTADRDLPHVDSNGHTATRHTTRAVSVSKGDAIRVEAVPDRGEPAPVDYVEVTQAASPNR
jgi:alpha-glucuronidase